MIVSNLSFAIQTPLSGAFNKSILNQLELDIAPSQIKWDKPDEKNELVAYYQEKEVIKVDFSCEYKVAKAQYDVIGSQILSETNAGYILDAFCTN